MIKKNIKYKNYNSPITFSFELNDSNLIVIFCPISVLSHKQYFVGISISLTNQSDRGCV